MAYKRLDAIPNRWGKSPHRPPIEWMLLKIWLWRRWKVQQQKIWMEVLLQILDTSVAYGRRPSICLRFLWMHAPWCLYKFELTELRIERQLLCCSSHRHSHRVVCHKCRIAVRKQCTLAQAKGWSIPPTVHNTHKYSIHECRCRPYWNAVLFGPLHSIYATMCVQFPMKYFAWPCRSPQLSSSLAVYSHRWFDWFCSADFPMYLDYDESNRLYFRHSNHAHWQSYRLHLATVVEEQSKMIRKLEFLWDVAIFGEKNRN